MKKTALVASWFLVCLLTLSTSIILLGSQKPKFFISEDHLAVKPLLKTPPYEIFTALPRPSGNITQEVTTGDSRPFILENFLTANQSPLAPYASYILEVSDRHQLDFRLVVAIAMQESNAGKKIPQGSHNAWGFANGATDFPSWPEAIEKVAQTLKEDYIGQGLTTPVLMMPKYAPPSVAKGGPWAAGVEYFMTQLQ